ncbi:unnamed protein product, partial [Sphagnum balticum]
GSSLTDYIHYGSTNEIQFFDWPWQVGRPAYSFPRYKLWEHLLRRGNFPVRLPRSGSSSASRIQQSPSALVRADGSIKTKGVNKASIQLNETIVHPTPMMALPFTEKEPEAQASWDRLPLRKLTPTVSSPPHQSST